VFGPGSMRRSALTRAARRDDDRPVVGTHGPGERTVLVVSPSDERRHDWAAVVRDGRTSVMTCTGPSGQCVLLRGLDRCPLVGRSDVVLYDLDATSPSFLALLLHAHRETEVVVVRDRLVRGTHRPSAVLRRLPHHRG